MDAEILHSSYDVRDEIAIMGKKTDLVNCFQCNLQSAYESKRTFYVMHKIICS